MHSDSGARDEWISSVSERKMVDPLLSFHVVSSGQMTRFVTFKLGTLIILPEPRPRPKDYKPAPTPIGYSSECL